MDPAKSDGVPRPSHRPSRVVQVWETVNTLVDRYHLDALTGRFEAERTVIRGGRARRVTLVKRLFGFPWSSGTGQRLLDSPR